MNLDNPITSTREIDRSDAYTIWTNLVPILDRCKVGERDDGFSNNTTKEFDYVRKTPLSIRRHHHRSLILLRGCLSC